MEELMKYYIGIDLGGTNIVAGLVDENYQILKKVSRKTNRPRPAEEIAADMAACALDAIKEGGLTPEQVEWIGIGTPGGGGHVSHVTAYGNRYRHVGWLSGGASILRFGSSSVNTYDNYYIDNDDDMPLPFFPSHENLPLH